MLAKQAGKPYDRKDGKVGDVSTGSPEGDVDPKWTFNHFAQSNPDGPDRGNTAALLRRVADTIDSLGVVEVEDIVYGSYGEDDDLFVRVYYSRR